ncbi:MAG: alpha/beta fold hydrolase [Candidatus Bathyarchaeia archaeon]
MEVLKARPAEGYVTSMGFRMHYLEWGERGREIVALHSMMMDAHGLDTFSQSMAKDSHVLAIDLLGHGDSAKPTERVSLEEHTEVVRGVVRDRGFERPVLVGHSIGGMISMVYAAKHPDEVSQMILVDIAPWDPTRERRRVSIPTPEFFESEDEALAYFRQRHPKFTADAYKNRLRHGLKRTEDGRLRLKTSMETIEMIRKTSLGIDLWPYVEGIETPTLLIRGTESEAVSPNSVERMRRTLRDFRVVDVAGATHMVPQDCPMEFEEAVRDFIGQV